MSVDSGKLLCQSNSPIAWLFENHPEFKIEIETKVRQLIGGDDYRERKSLSSIMAVRNNSRAKTQLVEGDHE